MQRVNHAAFSLYLAKKKRTGNLHTNVIFYGVILCKGGTGLDFTWYESAFYGLVSGLTDIIPVSAHAHRLLLLKLYGETGDVALLRLFIHLGVFAAALFHCQPHITRMLRAKRLSRIPKRRRKRPLDTKSMMDFSLWKTMLVPVILSFFLYPKVQPLETSLVWVSVLILLNGLIMYIPQFFPSSNKDSRTLSRVEGLVLGVGGAAAILPGISGMGMAVSLGSLCGLERSYSLAMSLLMNLVMWAGFAVFDAMAMVKMGMHGISLAAVLQCLLAGITAFTGAHMGIEMMRKLSQNRDYTIFAYYCWGLALFTFALNLMA